ncbi:hypothetical protein Cgig2_008561 [Carnegiea gigantea]|uniref:Myb/SANT-like domain-containing protein n=1 Tax=Carnegiea gigantea TaxID=171969 RepID=A0A9Q1JRA7_9CARY|nr:hypothetical protein Cgig2_008561 [Carnegiea gigantea]
MGLLSLVANDLNEEDAVVIGATASLLRVTSALLRNHNNRDIDNETRIPQIPHQPFINRDVDRENYINTADITSKKFNLKCLWNHIDNHLKTVKTAWGIIAKLRSQSGCGWDENMRTIRMSPYVYNTYVKVNPTHEEYLNKKIDMYDEMAIVVGKDVARGSGAKSFDDVDIKSLGVTNLEEKGDGDDEFVKENDKQLTSSAPLESRTSRKRARDDDLELQNISTRMAEVAIALQKMFKSKLNVDLLYQEVMKTEGFEEDFLGSAFDHLVQREHFAKGFLAKSDKLRRIWLEKFEENK